MLDVIGAASPGSCISHAPGNHQPVSCRITGRRGPTQGRHMCSEVGVTKDGTCHELARIGGTLKYMSS